MENNVEKFIQILEARIVDKEKELKALDKDDYINKGVISGMILGISHSLNLFKILNDR